MRVLASALAIVIAVLLIPLGAGNPTISRDDPVGDQFVARDHPGSLLPFGCHDPATDVTRVSISESETSIEFRVEIQDFDTTPNCAGVPIPRNNFRGEMHAYSQNYPSSGYYVGWSFDSRGNFGGSVYNPANHTQGPVEGIGVFDGDAITWTIPKTGVIHPPWPKKAEPYALDGQMTFYGSTRSVLYSTYNIVDAYQSG